MTLEQQHISQPLAKFLKDNGFEKESLFYYLGDILVFKTSIGLYSNEGAGMNLHPYVDMLTPALSWFDILVTYAEDFGKDYLVCRDCGKKADYYGDNVVLYYHCTSQDCPNDSIDANDNLEECWYIPEWKYNTNKILSLLHQGKVAEAENTVREQFINKK